MISNPARKPGIEFATAGSSNYAATPAAFKNAPKVARQILKLEYVPRFSAENELEIEISTDRFLIDLRGLDPAAIDMAQLISDCDILKELATKSPDDMKQIITELQKGTWDSVNQAKNIAERIGATEEQIAEKGGGLIWIVVGLAMLLGGCISQNNKAQKATTTPRKPTASGGGPK